MVLSDADYRNKVLGGWLGKSIGGTLGMHLEGTLTTNTLTYYDPYPDKPLPNDDLDWQVIWLDMMLRKGTDITSNDLREAWLEHLVNPYPDEYAKCDLNMKRGLLPPVCGWFNNYFIDCMGSPIRSEVWAMICPGNPALAAAYARIDAILDHADEGVYGEIFLAVVESTAFIETDFLNLIQIGLSFIPKNCQTRRAVDYVVEAKNAGKDWLQTRNDLVEMFNTTNPCYAPLNLGFMVIGLLFGKDFSEKLCLAVNCGYDTDCTGATVGSILGIIDGSSAIPEKWVRPVGLHLEHDKRWMKDYKPFKDIEELTSATVKVGKALTEKQRHENTRSVDEMIREGHSFVQNLEKESAFRVKNRINSGYIDFDYQGAPAIGKSDLRIFNVTFRPDGLVTSVPTLKLLSDPELKVSIVKFEKMDGCYSWNLEASLESDETIKSFFMFQCLLEQDGQEIGEMKVSLIHKKQWKVSKPLKCMTVDEFDQISLEDIEKADFSDLDVDDESLGSLFQCEISCAVFAKRNIYFPKDMEVKVIADCSEPVAVWHNGINIIRQNKFKEIVPSAHRMAVYHNVMPVKQGLNTFVFKFLRTQSNYQGYFFIANPETYMGFVDIQ